ncbi:hypothetical protein Cni_G21729 [Canna indica]|uniref:Uncharacterized protein n=1 Tax=Canna indica TaxID=4628 RepID=A0AAQ3QLZ1_9LILI|nr:hypothetical protein Cni_G21729 [Canna indica]
MLCFGTSASSSMSSSSPSARDAPLPLSPPSPSTVSHVSLSPGTVPLSLGSPARIAPECVSGDSDKVASIKVSHTAYGRMLCPFPCTEDLLLQRITASYFHSELSSFHPALVFRLACHFLALVARDWCSDGTLALCSVGDLLLYSQLLFWLFCILSRPMWQVLKVPYRSYLGSIEWLWAYCPGLLFILFVLHAPDPHVFVGPSTLLAGK